MAKRQKAKTTTTVEGVLVSQPSPERRIESTAAPNTPTFYANNAFVEVTTWDVRIRLGLIQSATKELISVTDVAHVYMSHAHAKAFLEALGQTMARIEKFMATQAASTPPAKTH